MRSCVLPWSVSLLAVLAPLGCADDGRAASGGLATQVQAHRDCLMAEASGEAPPGDTDLDGWCDDEDTCPDVVNDQFADVDADGVGDACDPCRGDHTTGDADTDRWCADLDCDDTDKNVYPGAPERCDGVLNNCQGALPADEGDSDGDGTPDCDDRCEGNDAYGDRDDDGLCGDVDPCLGDNATGDADDDGVCDDRDRCIGFDATGDADSDGFCGDRDCDDARSDINPETPETCDGRDNDCDSLVDDNPAALCRDGQTCAAAACTALRPCYADDDGDGAGDARDVVLIDPAGDCAALGRLEDANDCDDSPEGCGRDCAPGLPERCDDLDHDCDGDPRNGAQSLCDNPVFGQGVCTLAGCDVLCTPGFEPRQGTCVDVDECSAGLPADCADNGVCRNVQGGYVCTCALGFADTDGDGSRCDPVCGDGVWLASEACDDGNARPGDGCDPACVAEPGWTCVDGDCSPTCGDGQLLGAEACDDAATAPGDGCGPDCRVEAGFSCTGQPSVCTVDPFCGDGRVDPAEACDDQNGDAGDGCSPACVVEDGFVCVSSGAGSLCVADDGAEGSGATPRPLPQPGTGCATTPRPGSDLVAALGVLLLALRRPRKT